MSDPTPILRMLGVQEEPADSIPVAADDARAEAATPTDHAEPSEDTSLDEALADALGGERTPQETPEAGTQEPDAGEPLVLTQDQINALVAENEQFKAQQAQFEIAQQDAQFEARWDDEIDRVQQMYEDIAEAIEVEGKRQGRSQDEINSAIYVRVVLGQGLTDRYGRQMMGHQDWMASTAQKRTAAAVQYYARRNEPSALDQMAQSYNLTDADKAVLAGIANLPREQLAAVAQALAAKNQGVNQTLQQVKTQASRNVAASLSNGINPGTPGAAPPKKPYQFTHDPRLRHDENTLFAARMGLVRRTG